MGDARLLDNTPPTINIIVPATVTYTVNEAVGANYNCTDAGSGVATCAGTAANGANISTSTAGNHSFSVNASDRVENASSKAVNYAVSYKVCLLYDPSKTVKSGSTVPIKIQLCDAGDTNLSSAGITVHAQSVTQVAANTSGPVTDAGNANPDCNFRYDALLGGYLFNLNTRGLATGTDNLNFTVDSDPVPHAVVFQVK